jgi:hypothetical protein
MLQEVEKPINPCHIFVSKHVGYVFIVQSIANVFKLQFKFLFSYLLYILF